MGARLFTQFPYFLEVMCIAVFIKEFVSSNTTPTLLISHLGLTFDKIVQQIMKVS